MTNEPKTLGEMEHTNPYTGRVFGETQAYGRGKRVAADGGTDADDGGTLSDVSPTANDADGVQRSFDRGESR